MKRTAPSPAPAPGAGVGWMLGRGRAAALRGTCALALVVTIPACSGTAGSPDPTASTGPTAGPSAPAAVTQTAGSAGATVGPSVSGASPGTGGSASDVSAAPSPPAPAAARELPRGGRTIFPAHRLVGFSGYPGAPALGRLGVGALADRTAEIDALAAQYAAGRQGLPVLELIATVVHSRPGRDGLYRTRIDDQVVARHLEAARAVKGILLLNIQPGRAAFLDEVRHWERWLREPDVGLALDPEWAVGPGQVPGRVFGRTSGAELDAIAAYVSALVAEGGLPEKVVLYHQLHVSIVRDPAGLRPHPGVALVVSVDGIGTPAEKTTTWKKIDAVTPAHVRRGFKLFYDEDTRRGPLMTPAQVLALTPQPEYVLYE